MVLFNSIVASAAIGLWELRPSGVRLLLYHPSNVNDAVVGALALGVFYPPKLRI